MCKINIDSDGRLAMTAMIRKVFAEKPEAVNAAIDEFLRGLQSG